MRVILYMATTINGYIARKNDETPWSDEEWQSFKKKVSEIGNIVIGQRTYDIMKKGEEFQKIGNPFTIVLTRKKQEGNSNFAFVNSPKKALDLLKEKGFSEALIAGGSMLNSSFMQEDLIDEIYLDIEPFVFGNGIKLFADNDFEKKLELIETKPLSKNTIQLHYKVIK
ncbi:dihydrofolate reductase [Patescibacteria group bacterium]|nr:MAG: dihydrofolate reductase [Patescibacteria group bacterium]